MKQATSLKILMLWIVEITLICQIWATQSQFNTKNKTMLSQKNSKILNNLAQIPVTNNEDDLFDQFENSEFLQNFLHKIHKLKPKKGHHENKDSDFLINSHEELSGTSNPI